MSPCSRRTAGSSASSPASTSSTICAAACADAQGTLRMAQKQSNRRGFATRSIHAGQAPDPTRGAIMMPIYATSTYVQSSPGVHKGYEYSRTQNPTRMAYERCIADLESGTRGYAFASGMAATATLLELLDQGAHVVASDDLYGGTYPPFTPVPPPPAPPSPPFLPIPPPPPPHAPTPTPPGPLDTFLALGGLQTLALRMERHCPNAQAVAEHLARHRHVARVHYPGLASHQQHALARRQMHLYGGMVTIELKGGLAEARRFLERVEIFALAESLGGVESLIEHPAIMTHASLPPEQRQTLGIGDTLIRLSVGVEDVDDLIADLDQALR